MKLFKIKKIICYVILVIASIALGWTAYAGIGALSAIYSGSTYSNVMYQNMNYVLFQVRYPEEADKISSYDESAKDGYIDYATLQTLYEDYSYGVIQAYNEILDFIDNLYDYTEEYGDYDAYYYDENDNKVFIYQFFSNANGELFSYRISEADDISEEEELELLSRLVEFERLAYISDESLAAGLDAVREECSYYISALEVMDEYLNAEITDDGLIAYDYDSNFFFNVKITYSDGEVKTYSNGYDENAEYEQTIWAVVTPETNRTIEMEGFKDASSNVEYYLDYILKDLQAACEDYGFTSIEVKYAVDTSWESGSTLALYYRELYGQSMEQYMIYVVCAAVAAAVVMLIMFIRLTMLAGHKNKKDVPAVIKADRIYLIFWLIAGAAITLGLSALGYIWYYYEDVYGSVPSDFVSQSIGEAWCFCIYVSAVIFITAHVLFIIYLSFVRRIKAKVFWKTTLIGFICGQIKRFALFLKKCFIKIIENKRASVNTLIFAGGFYVINLIGVILLIMCSWRYDFDFGVVIMIGWIIINAAVVYFIWKYMKEFDMIETATKEIASGNQNYKLTDKFIYPSHRHIVQNINNIGDGISAAVEASMKNERMKTDLITNVSHDLKTPLTSIINYIKLLKDENIDNENARKYISVLDDKAERLKVLTDDLVEASKLSSGTVELNMSDINIVELINQANGEFEEKFAARGLQVITDISDEQIIARCDGRKIWRVLDNLYGNVCKYAMPGTRVYVDVRLDDKVCISVKNISENRLNFDASELTERFVRGDISRNTEGSGLGLSIAKSIVERHDGIFEIILDGDLFKVNIEFPVK